MLCNKCQTREATIHWTTCTNMPGEEPKSLELCRQCFEESDLEGARMLHPLPDMGQARCRYCDGEPYIGGRDPLSLQSGVHTISFMCKPCAEEYFGILRRQFPGLGDPDRTEEQLALLVSKVKSCNFQAILAELEEQMKQWVATRKLT